MIDHAGQFATQHQRPSQVAGCEAVTRQVNDLTGIDVRAAAQGCSDVEHRYRFPDSARSSEHHQSVIDPGNGGDVVKDPSAIADVVLGPVHE